MSYSLLIDLHVHLFQIMFVHYSSCKIDRLFKLKVIDFDEVCSEFCIILVFLTDSITPDLHFISSRTSDDRNSYSPGTIS